MSFVRTVNEERVFSTNFMKRQMDIFNEASRTFTQNGLLEKSKLEDIMIHMNDLYIDTNSYSIAGKLIQDRNYQNLLHLINSTIEKLSKHYQWTKIHPLIPALNKVKANVENYIKIVHPQYDHQGKAMSSNQNRAESTANASSTYPAAIGENRERVLSDNFVKRQAKLIEDASKAVTEDGLLEENLIKAIIDYMQDLHTSTDNFNTFGIIVANRNYENLLTLIDNTLQILNENYKWSSVHPLVPPLQQIKKNIQQCVIASQPQFAQNVKDNQSSNLSIIANARWERAKDTVGILTCLLWFIPEKIISLDNGCETACNSDFFKNKDGICPSRSLPKKSVSGDTIYWNLWAPGNSVRAMCKDLREEGAVIDHLKSAPVSHTMS